MSQNTTAQFFSRQPNGVAVASVLPTSPMASSWLPDSSPAASGSGGRNSANGAVVARVWLPISLHRANLRSRSGVWWWPAFTAGGELLPPSPPFPPLPSRSSSLTLDLSLSHPVRVRARGCSEGEPSFGFSIVLRKAGPQAAFLILFYLLLLFFVFHLLAQKHEILRHHS